MAVKIVKSVARVLEILELFDHVQEPLPAVDVAERLGYPLASTHEILKTMVELGFFSYGDPKWTYKPSSRFPETVEWVREASVQNSNIFALMEALSNATWETINLSRMSSSQVKIVKGLECRHEVGVSAKPGTIMEASLSLTGIVALAHLDTANLNNFFESLKISDPAVYEATDFDLIEKIHTDVKHQGWCLQTDLMINGIGAVCCPVLSSDNQAYVIGIVGPSDRIRNSAMKHVQILKTEVKNCGVTTKFPIKL